MFCVAPCLGHGRNLAFLVNNKRDVAKRFMFTSVCYAKVVFESLKHNVSEENSGSVTAHWMCLSSVGCGDPLFALADSFYFVPILLRVMSTGVHSFTRWS